MVYERRAPRRSDDDRLVDRFTRRETPAQRSRRIAKLRVPEEVVTEFCTALTTDTARYARTIAAHMTPATETRTMTHQKRSGRKTRKAEPQQKVTGGKAQAKKAAQREQEALDRVDTKIERYTAKLARARGKVERYGERLGYWTKKKLELKKK